MTDRKSYWLSMVHSYVAGVSPEDASAIADRLVAGEAAGSCPGVWHASSEYFGTLDRCHCCNCTKARGGKQLQAGITML